MLLTSEGSALTRFRRPLAFRNDPAADAAATELQKVELPDDALALTLHLPDDWRRRSSIDDSRRPHKN